MLMLRKGMEIRAESYHCSQRFSFVRAGEIHDVGQ
jgi:hypothetical protein